MENPVVIISRNPRIQELLRNLDRVIPTQTTILITGETGTGKEVLADYIHQTSDRAPFPFVKLSLSAMPEDLLASELFGHERGAYTSATTEKKGLFEVTNRGTLFLDDIDDVPLSIQTKLLRFLESGDMIRVGGIHPVKVDVRLVVASKVNLKKMVDSGRFRSDLYYRLHVYPVQLPPLRDRREDIPLLVDFFNRQFGNGAPIRLDEKVLSRLMAHDWPGNIRELKNVVHRLVLLNDSKTGLPDLPEDFLPFGFSSVSGTDCLSCLIGQEKTFEQVVHCLEGRLIRYAMAETGGNKQQAAHRLGLSPSTFRDKLERVEKGGISIYSSCSDC